LASSYFSGQTLDDVMRLVIQEIMLNGIQIKPSKGSCKELTGVLLEIENPRARLSRTETKGKPFSCLGELCWYLARNNDLNFISYYIKKYEEYADGDIIYGGYGPRLFSWKGINQIDQVISLLREKPDSRKAVIQLFDAKDIIEPHNDVPCTCVLQFLIRNKKLNMIIYMRSNDVFLGLPHDVFCFTMIQEIIARSLSTDLGYYKHSVGSIHLYEENKFAASQFLEEGWQPTNMAMPPMPLGDPWPAIQYFLEAESSLRTGGELALDLSDLDPYWADLIRLLKVFRKSKNENMDEIIELQKEMSSNIYDSFINKKLSRFQGLNS
jgi:thymidylate synthase